MGEADDLRKVLADIVLDAVLHPDSPRFELVRRDVIDRARMMVDHADIAAAAERARAARPDEKGERAALAQPKPEKDRKDG